MWSIIEQACSNIDLVLTVRTFFLSSAAVGAIFHHLPYLRARYMDYGIRSGPHGRRDKAGLNHPLSSSSSAVKAISKLLDPVFSTKVPHWYFLHYYVVSVLSSLFWGYQLRSRGQLMQLFDDLKSPAAVEVGMSRDQVWLCWSLLLVQGLRRLMESASVERSTRATMPLPIYLIGILYYLGVNVAVWLEGLDAFLRSPADAASRPLISFKTSVLLGIFFAASTLQSICHRHLASLRKYSLPSHALFRYIVCPHYLMECVIYFALTSLAAPAGDVANVTMLCVLAFVAINLGVVADTTREWWKTKFGTEAVHNRWRMIPVIW